MNKNAISSFSFNNAALATVFSAGAAASIAYWSGHVIKMIQNIEKLSLLNAATIPPAAFLLAAGCEYGTRKFLESALKIKDISVLSVISTSLGLSAGVSIPALAMYYRIIPISLEASTPLIALGALVFIIAKLVSKASREPLAPEKIQIPCTHENEINILKYQNASLTNTITTKETEISKLKEENKDSALHNEIESLKKENTTLKSELQTTKDNIASRDSMRQAFNSKSLTNSQKSNRHLSENASSPGNNNKTYLEKQIFAQPQKQDASPDKSHVPPIKRTLNRTYSEKTNSSSTPKTITSQTEEK